MAGGLLALIGIGKGDTEESGKALAAKLVNLRIFDDDRGRMNRSLLEVGGSLLCVPQFTLYGDCGKGRRPSYGRAASPEAAQPLYEAFLASLRAFGVRVESGRFRAAMKVELVNDGPVTLLLDSEQLF
jgi:D-tyrosyl-tRNA(Tyr) deacylase